MLSGKVQRIYGNRRIIVGAFSFYNARYESNVVRSKISFDIPRITLFDHVWKNLDRWHDKTAIVCAETGRSYLYYEVYRKSCGVANFLRAFKTLRKGDTVAAILPNVPEYPMILLGAVQAGLKVTTVNPLYTTDEMAKQVADSNAKLIFTIPEYWTKVSAAMGPKNIPAVLIGHQQNQALPRGAIKFDEIPDSNGCDDVSDAAQWDDVILMPYSSGTTGVPKGVELTTKNIVSNISQVTHEHFRLHRITEGDDQDVIPAVLPIFHAFGLTMGTLNMLASGCKLVTVRKFGLDIFLDVFKTHRPTFAYFVPPIILMLTNHPKILPEYVQGIRTILSGAAPLGAADIERLQEKTQGKTSILQAYGLTETSPATHLQTDRTMKLGGSGHCLPNTECKIVPADQEGTEGVGPNIPGQLYIRGPQVMKGYYNNQQATDEVLDSHGWFRTGDMAFYDENGEFFITDRLKELIKVNAFQVAPAELEELLRSHPDVEDAAVLGVPHEAFGEVPRAFVVPKRNASLNVEEIHDYVNRRVAKYKQLKGGVEVISEIPKSSAGKILRRKLR